MKEVEFLQRWHEERPMYSAWADIVQAEIQTQLEQSIAPTQLGYFIKIPVQPRLKSDDTLLDKAFHRKKPYKDPYNDITDKVGMRFVVLLTSDIQKICSVVENSQNIWTSSKDRDYEEERLEKPLEFSYQSVHYIVRAAADTNSHGINILMGTPCEIQIRTLLQHAHSELTHDTLYKPKTTAKPEVKRTIAKSMALIEATDEFFVQAMQNLNSAMGLQNEFLSELRNGYKRHTGKEPEFGISNQLIVDAFADRLSLDAQAILSYIEANKFIVDRIKERYAERHLFRQPSILLGYYLVDIMPAQAKEYWPLDSADLEIVFSDLGKSFDG